MINLAGLGALFFDAMPGPRDLNSMRMHDMFAVDYEPECQRLQSEGRAMRWVGETRLKQYSRRGWRPVTKPDCAGCPTVFMDSAGNLVLLYEAGEHVRDRGARGALHAAARGPMTGTKQAVTKRA